MMVVMILSQKCIYLGFWCYFSVVMCELMNTESKGRGWYGKIYRKLETILVEVDSLAAQVPFLLVSETLRECKEMKVLFLMFLTG